MGNLLEAISPFSLKSSYNSTKARRGDKKFQKSHNACPSLYLSVGAGHPCPGVQLAAIHLTDIFLNAY